MALNYDINTLQIICEPIIKSLKDKVYQSERASANYAGKVDVSEIVLPFKHLKLNDEYLLIAYASHEYHGLYGKIVAMKKSEDIPEIYMQRKGFLCKIELPKTAVSPEDVIICDGTPEGYFEAILLSHILPTLVKNHYCPPGAGIVLSRNNYLNSYTFYIEPTKWSVEYVEEEGSARIMLFEKVFDSIYLCSYRFNYGGQKFSDFLLETKFTYDFLQNKEYQNRHTCKYEVTSICIAEKIEENYLSASEIHSEVGITLLQSVKALVEKNDRQSFAEFKRCFKAYIDNHVYVNALAFPEKGSFDLQVLNENSKYYVAMFSEVEQAGTGRRLMSMDINSLIKTVTEDKSIEGIIIDPFTNKLVVDKNMLNDKGEFYEMV